MYSGNSCHGFAWHKSAQLKITQSHLVFDGRCHFPEKTGTGSHHRIACCKSGWQKKFLGFSRDRSRDKKVSNRLPEKAMRLIRCNVIFLPKSVERA